MFVIVVYDIGVKRVTKVHKYLKQWLHWKQNSVFHGELSPAQLKLMKSGLSELIEETEDFVIFYGIKSPKGIEVTQMGTDKNPTGFVL